MSTSLRLLHASKPRPKHRDNCLNDFIARASDLPLRHAPRPKLGAFNKSHTADCFSEPDKEVGGAISFARLGHMQMNLPPPTGCRDIPLSYEEPCCPCQFRAIDSNWNVRKAGRAFSAAKPAEFVRCRNRV